MPAFSVPSFELDLFGRVRSLTHVQLERYLATEAGARATRLTLVADIANAWLDLCRRFEPAADRRADRRERRRRASSLTRAPARRRDRAAHRPPPGRADPGAGAGRSRPPAHRGRAGRQRAAAAGRRADRPEAARRLDRRGVRQRSRRCPPGSIPTSCCAGPTCSRPNISCAPPTPRSALRARRLFPRITLTGLLGFASSALTKLFTGGAFGWSAGADATYTIFQAGAGHANVRLSEAQRNAAVATYQKTDPDRVPRSRRRARPARHDQRRDRRPPAPAGRRPPTPTLLTEARYREGIDPFLTVLDRAALLLFGAAGDGADQADRRPEHRHCTSRSAATRCSRRPRVQPLR